MNLTIEQEKKCARKVENASPSNINSYLLGIEVKKIILNEKSPEGRPQYLARGLLEQLVDENSNKKSAARVVGLVQRFLHSSRKYRFNLSVYDQIPTEREALELYKASKQAVEEKRTDKPWKFISGYGEKTFKLLEAYLKIRKLI